MHQHGSKYCTHRTSPPDPGVGSKCQIPLFQNMVMLHVQIKGTDECKQIFCPYTHPRPQGGIKGQNIFFLKLVIKRKEVKTN